MEHLILTMHASVRLHSEHSVYSSAASANRYNLMNHSLCVCAFSTGKPIDYMWPILDMILATDMAFFLPETTPPLFSTHMHTKWSSLHGTNPPVAELLPC